MLKKNTDTEGSLKKGMQSIAKLVTFYSLVGNERRLFFIADAIISLIAVNINHHHCSINHYSYNYVPSLPRQKEKKEKERVSA